MSAERKTGKERIKIAKQLAKKHGVDVLGWNDKPGKEFISVNGDGDKLQCLKKEMEQGGWYNWPVDEAQEGYFMDFGMYPPTAASQTKNNGVDDESEISTYSGADFRYSGPTTLFFCNLLILLAIPLLIILPSLKTIIAHGFILKTASIALSIILPLALLLLFLDWITVFADNSQLTIRKYICGKTKKIPLTDIKKINIYADPDRYPRSIKLKFIGINLKSGKAFDLFLPKQKRNELMAFIKSRISGNKS